MLEVVTSELAVPARGRHARRGQDACSRRWARPTRSRSSTRSRADEEVSLYKHGAPPNEWVDVCEGPHVPVDGLPQGGQAHARRRRVLARRRAQPDAPAHLRDGVPDAGGARRAPQAARGGAGSATTASSARSSSSSCSTRSPRRCRSSCRAARSSTNAWSTTCAASTSATATKRSSRRRSSTRSSSGRAGTSATTTRTCTASGPRTCSRSTPSDGQASKAGPRRSDAFALKPMNCPSHCVIFGSKRRSYRELPWRVADFGRLHRYERGGVVHGLARVRSFAQDDAHIFCAEDQVAGEIENFIALLHERLQGVPLREDRHQARDAPPRQALRHRRGVGHERARARRRPRARGPRVRGLARRRRVLRAEDRVSRARRAQALLAARHDPVRPEPSRALRPRATSARTARSTAR